MSVAGWTSLERSRVRSDQFKDEEVVVTSVALERKYILGGIIDQCNEILEAIEAYHDYYFPYAQHGALLYSVLQRVNLLSPKNYQFSIGIIYSLLDQFIPMKDDKTAEDREIWKDVDDKRRCSPYEKEVTNVFCLTEHPQLPPLIEAKELKKDELTAPDHKQIDDNLKKMIQSFIRIILPYVVSSIRSLDILSLVVLVNCPATIDWSSSFCCISF